jgi:hypothetical protein
MRTIGTAAHLHSSEPLPRKGEPPPLAPFYLPHQADGANVHPGTERCGPPSER